MCEACRDRSRRVSAPYHCATDGRIRSAFALWKFDRDEPVRMVLHRLKYGNCPWIGYHLGSTISASTPACPSGSWDYIVPVPLHPRRLLERGYNQSEWIARGLGRALDVRVTPQALARRKNTKSQTDLSKEDRTSNVSGAFVIDGDTDLTGSSVLLVDDTLTTGATLTAAATTLVESGASVVQPVAVALATLHRDEEQPDAGSVIPSQHESFHHESSSVGHNL